MQYGQKTYIFLKRNINKICRLWSVYTLERLFSHEEGMRLKTDYDNIGGPEPLCSAEKEVRPRRPHCIWLQTRRPEEETYRDDVD